jgi:thiol-disulfide isomerase/thioredoxin
MSIMSNHPFLKHNTSIVAALFTFLVFFASSSGHLYSQQEIKVKSAVSKDSVRFYLVKHHLDQIVQEDSVTLLAGQSSLVLKRTHSDGLYSLIGYNKEPLPLILLDQKPIQIDYDTSQVISNSIIVGSDESTEYQNLLKSLNPHSKHLQVLRQQFDWLRNAGLKDKEAFDDLRSQMLSVQDSISKLQTEAVKAYPGRFWSKMLKSLQFPTLPDSIKAISNTPDGKKIAASWVKEQFWDQYDFNDLRLAESGVFPQKIDQWMQMHRNGPDQMQSGIDVLMKKLGTNKVYTDFTLPFFINKFENPSLHGGDQIFVYLADQYFTEVGIGKTDIATFERIKYKADAFRPTLNGLVAPEIALNDPSGKLTLLSTFEAKYTVLYFFSPLCDKCAAATPMVVQTVKDYEKFGIKAFGVTLDDAPEVWKEYVKTNLPGWTAVHGNQKPHPLEKLYANATLPAIYLLDENKKIIKKRFGHEQLSDMLFSIVNPK